MYMDESDNLIFLYRTVSVTKNEEVFRTSYLRNIRSFNNFTPALWDIRHDDRGLYQAWSEENLAERLCCGVCDP